MPAATAITARFERTLSNSSPPGSWLSRPATVPTVSTNPICLRPFLVGQISGDVGAETSQCGSEEKVNTIEAMKGRIGRRCICRTK